MRLCTADLCLWFCIWKKPVFSWRSTYFVIFTFKLHSPYMKVSFSMFFNSRCKTFTNHVTQAAQLGGAMSRPASDVVCLLRFAWRWSRIAMTVSAEIWRLGCSETSVMSDLIQNIGKTSKVVLKLKIYTWLIILNVNIRIEITVLRLYGVMKNISLV